MGEGGKRIRLTARRNVGRRSRNHEPSIGGEERDNAGRRKHPDGVPYNARSTRWMRRYGNVDVGGEAPLHERQFLPDVRQRPLGGPQTYTHRQEILGSVTKENFFSPPPSTAPRGRRRQGGYFSTYPFIGNTLPALLSFFIALTSICLIRSLVTLNSRPSSSRVCSFSPSIP